jgi:hypothetical protein
MTTTGGISGLNPAQKAMFFTCSIPQRETPLEQIESMPTYGSMNYQDSIKNQT